MSVSAGAVLDRSHLVVPRRRARAAVPARGARHGRILALLVALALGAGVAVWLIAAASPGASAGGAGGAAPAPVEVVGAGTVVASASCTDPGAQDTIAVDAPGGRRLLPLDACGSTVGATVTVRMAFDDAGPPIPARMVGTGGEGALVPNGEASSSPLTGRLAILLTGVAGLATAGLLVAVARDRGRRRDRVTPTTVPAARRATRPSTPATGERSASRERRVATAGAGRTAARTPARPARGRPSAACRTTSGARRPGDRPGSRRPAPGRRRH